MSEPIAPSAYHLRQERLARAINAANLDALALNPGPSLTYLTGLHFHLMERPVVVIFASSGTPQIVLPELEAGKTSKLPFPLRSHTYGEDPKSWENAFWQAVNELNFDKDARIGV